MVSFWVMSDRIFILYSIIGLYVIKTKPQLLLSFFDHSFLHDCLKSVVLRLSMTSTNLVNTSWMSSFWRCSKNLPLGEDHGEDPERAGRTVSQSGLGTPCDSPEWGGCHWGKGCQGFHPELVTPHNPMSDKITQWVYIWIFFIILINSYLKKSFSIKLMLLWAALSFF